MEHEGDGDTNCKSCTWNNPQRIGNFCMYIKGLVTFVCTLLLYKKSACPVVMCGVYFSNSKATQYNCTLFLQSSNVHTKVTSLLEYIIPWWWPKSGRKY